MRKFKISGTIIPFAKHERLPPKGGKLSPQVTDEGKAPPWGGAVTRSVTEVGGVLERHPTPLIPLPWRGRNNKKTEGTSVFLYFTLFS